MKQTVAIIGCGSIGSRHARLLRETPELRDLCDCLLLQDQDATRAERLAAELGCAWVPQALNAFTVADAAMICTWPDSHLALARQAIGAKVKRVFIEKPLSVSMEGVWQLVNFAEGTKTMVACNWRFHPNIPDLPPVLSRLDTVRFHIAPPDGIRSSVRLDLGSHAYDLAKYLGSPDARLDIAYGFHERRELVFEDGTVLDLSPTDTMYSAELAHFLMADPPMNGLQEAAHTLEHLLTSEDV